MLNEKFEMLVYFDEKKNKWNGEDLLGIMELEKLLQETGSSFYIKESPFKDLVLVELEKNPIKTFQTMAKTPTKVINRVTFVETTVETSSTSITETTLKFIESKAISGDTFSVRCHIQEGNYINSCRELINRIENEIMNKYQLQIDHEKPHWLVKLELLGDLTGITVMEAFE